MFDKALRALALSGGLATSVAMFAEQLVNTRAELYVSINAQPGWERWRTLLAMGLAAAVVVAVGVGFMWRGGPGAIARWHRATHRLSPLLLLGLLPPLLRVREWDPLTGTVAISLFVLVAERTFRMRLAAQTVSPGRGPFTVIWSHWLGRDPAPRLGRPAAGLLGNSPGLARMARMERMARQWPAAVVGGAAAGYAVYMSLFTVWSHRRFGTYGYDLGQYNAVFFSTLHGRPLRCSPLGLTANWSDLSNHADLAVFALLPFYALRPGAETLLILQATIIALGAIPLFRFAGRRLPRAYALLLALAYLVYPPLHGANLFDFHFQPIAASFVLATIDFLDERRDWAAALTFVVALACREDISVGLAVAGAFFAFSGRRPVAGLIVAGISTLYFVLMRFFIMPAFGTWWFADLYKGLAADGFPGFGGALATLLSNPWYVLSTMLTVEKLRYLLLILVPLAFLPVRRWYLLAAVLPGAVFTVLTTKYAPTTDIAFQYSGHFTPYIFPAAALALCAYRPDWRATMGDARAGDLSGSGPAGEFGEIGELRMRAAARALLLATFLSSANWGAIPPRASFRAGFDVISMRRPSAADRQYERDLRALDGLAPADASVAVSDHELPHLSRMNLFSLRDGLFEADYLLFGTDSRYLGADVAEPAIARGEYVRLAEKSGLVLAVRADLAPAP